MKKTRIRIPRITSAIAPITARKSRATDRQPSRRARGSNTAPTTATIRSKRTNQIDMTRCCHESGGAHAASTWGHRRGSSRTCRRPPWSSGSQRRLRARRARTSPRFPAGPVCRSDGRPEGRTGSASLNRRFLSGRLPPRVCEVRWPLVLITPRAERLVRKALAASDVVLHPVPTFFQLSLVCVERSATIASRTADSGSGIIRDLLAGVTASIISTMIACSRRWSGGALRWSAGRRAVSRGSSAASSGPSATRGPRPHRRAIGRTAATIGSGWQPTPAGAGRASHRRTPRRAPSRLWPPSGACRRPRGRCLGGTRRARFDLVAFGPLFAARRWRAIEAALAGMSPAAVDSVAPIGAEVLTGRSSSLML